ncbi:MAG: hypothetical protein BYD32DRAFT_419631 [Podila humilis]|nr:MAG: hypothetical protein BYD32DRAFT_419631 [Podila humilis]
MFTCQSHTLSWLLSPFFVLYSSFFVPCLSCLHRASTLLATARASDTCSSQFALQGKIQYKMCPLHIIPVEYQGNITPQCSVLWRPLEMRYYSIDIYFFFSYLQLHYTEG